MMDMYDWSELLSRWECGDLTQEQAIGQLFLRVQAAEKTATSCQRQQELLKRQVVVVTNRVEALERQLPKSQLED